ncbi:hypothetical protein Pelo_18346 [Pelomyxa schiedti]|nr:hypothetical protein Pelo_18346 [Pelomyxa schiedti]
MGTAAGKAREGEEMESGSASGCGSSEYRDAVAVVEQGRDAAAEWGGRESAWKPPIGTEAAPAPRQGFEGA